ncbi:MAG: YitT family protein, partial [Caldilineaceae bacterium]|nr:YitT family protein [Caldilineaceae bacterium]
MLLLTLGALVAALGFSLFQVPYNIAAGGVSGIGIIVNHFTGVSVSLFYLLANIPLLLLGFFYLGRWRFLLTTVIAVVLFSVGTEYFPRILPQYMSEYPITDNVLLAAIYAGLIGGI